MKFHDECDLLKKERSKYEKARDTMYRLLASSFLFAGATVISMANFYSYPHIGPMFTFIVAGLTVATGGSSLVQYFKFRIGQSEVYTHADMDHKMKQAKAMMDRGKFMVNNEAVQEMFEHIANEHREHFGETDETGGEG